MNILHISLDMVLYLYKINRTLTSFNLKVIIMANIHQIEFPTPTSNHNMVVTAHQDSEAPLGGYAISFEQSEQKITINERTLDGFFHAIREVYLPIAMPFFAGNYPAIDINSEVVKSHREDKIKIKYCATSHKVTIIQTERREHDEDATLTHQNERYYDLEASRMELCHKGFMTLVEALMATAKVVTHQTELNRKIIMALGRKVLMDQEVSNQWNSLYMKYDGSYIRLDNHAKTIDCTINLTKGGQARINVHSKHCDMNEVTRLDNQEIHETVNRLYDYAIAHHKKLA